MPCPSIDLVSCVRETHLQPTLCRCPDNHYLVKTRLHFEDIRLCSHIGFSPAKLVNTPTAVVSANVYLAVGPLQTACMPSRLEFVHSCSSSVDSLGYAIAR